MGLFTSPPLDPQPGLAGKKTHTPPSLLPPSPRPIAPVTRGGGRIENRVYFRQSFWWCNETEQHREKNRSLDHDGEAGRGKCPAPEVPTCSLGKGSRAANQALSHSCQEGWHRPWQRQMGTVIQRTRGHSRRRLAWPWISDGQTQPLPKGGEGTHS